MEPEQRRKQAVITDNDLQQARDTAAEQSGYVEHARAAFRSGWNEAMRHVGLLMQTPGGDGCYCAHHPDDPAHTRDCYDLAQALTR
jgi:hypothetical protein